MKRSRLNRSKRLGADPEKVREFLKRGRQLERAALNRAGGMRRSSSKEGPLTPAAWRERVFELSEGLCVMTGARASHVEDRRFHAHHPVPKRTLRDRGLFGWVWDSRNGLWLRSDAHERHESASVRVPAEKLPASVWEFCAALDALEGTEWATMLVLRAHPPAGRSRVSHEEDVSDGEGKGRERDRRERD